MLDNNKYAVLALGYFDSVHLGHQAVIKSAVNLAKEYDAKTVVITFDGNLRAVLGDGTDKMVFNRIERERLIKQLGVDEVCFLPITKEFLSMEKQEFLTYLNSIYNVKGYVTGEDYKFGRLGSGTIKDLIEFAKTNNQQCKTIETKIYNKQRISTTEIKRLLSVGDIGGVNTLLGREYSITGKIYRDRKIGSSIGFPTINLKIESEKFRLKDGVYMGKTLVFNKEYKVIINYGARPTFSLTEKLIEAHIVDFSGELYDKEITIRFLDYLRDIIKFENAEKLKEQLEKDLNKVREIYD